jgi:ATP-dependent Clp protease ATP-binding subunit ClpA
MARLKVMLDPAKCGPEAETLAGELRKRVVGQEPGIAQIVNVFQSYRAGMTTPGRPVGSFLFLGPTGSGKTRMVEALAECLFNDPHAMVKIDCAEFQHSHEIAKLIGSPPGYLGHRETHALLSQDVLDQHQGELKLTLLLFDEIEKASDALWNLLLGILDKATLTLGDNRRVDFSRSMIFMTSNLGAAEMTAVLHPGLGFRTPAVEPAADTDKIRRAASEAARRRFSPEFMNRIDRTVVFQPLGNPELRGILDLELGLVRTRIAAACHADAARLSVSKAAKELLLAEGTDSRYGARHLRRAIERLLVQPLSNLIATGQVQAGDSVFVDMGSESPGLIFMKEPKPAVVAAASAAASTAA